MDPTLEESVKQYHPFKQNLILKQSEIYQPIFFNRSEMPFDPREANREYHRQRCGKKSSHPSKKK
jgi:hypothetical protein